MADVVIVPKTDAAPAEAVEAVTRAARDVNPGAALARGASPVALEAPLPAGTRVLVVEDGPTITHGGMAHGAGFVAARAAGAVIVDPRPVAAPAIREVYERYPHIGPVLPAVGYAPAQVEALARTIADAPAEAVVLGTPAEQALTALIRKPVVRARYEFVEAGEPVLERAVARWLRERGLSSRRGG
jgi:predicted GTPase